MEENTRMQVWQNNWEGDNAAPWQKNEVHGALVEYGLPLLQGSKKRCFVPLCGKSLDLKFLYDEGHTVVGVEGAEIGVKDFFELTGIPFKVKETPVKCYETPDERLRIYASDIFNVDPHILGKFDFIWDRGSLVAIYLKDRDKYSTLMKSIVNKNCQYLIESMFYDGVETPGGTGGAPRCVTDKHFEDLFGDVFNINHLNVTQPTVKQTKRWGIEEAWVRYSVLTPINN